jgi:hypothetical protein
MLFYFIIPKHSQAKGNFIQTLSVALPKFNIKMLNLLPD